MNSTVAALTQAAGLIERIRDVVAVLAASVGSGDTVTAEAAAMELAHLAGQVDGLLYTVRHGAGDVGLRILP